MKKLIVLVAMFISLLPGCKREDPTASMDQFEPSASAIAVTPPQLIDPVQAPRIASDGPTWKRDITTEAAPVNTPPAEAPPAAAPAPAADANAAAPAPRAGDPNGF